MAHLSEQDNFPQKIYKIDPNDPVKGGTPTYSADSQGNITSVTSGHANLQAKLLADRTKHLNSRLTTAEGNISSNDSDISGLNSRLTTAEGEIEDIESLGTTGDSYKEKLVNLIYPIGSIYTTVSSNSPNDLFGGTWEKFAQGRTLVGVDPSDDSFSTVKKTGGAATVKLTAAQSGLPGHTHGITDEGHQHNISIFESSGNASGMQYFQGSLNEFKVLHPNTNPSTTGISIDNCTEKEATSAHNNLQPYITVYFWKRTA